MGFENPNILSVVLYSSSFVTFRDTLTCWVLISFLFYIQINISLGNLLRMYEYCILTDSLSLSDKIHAPVFAGSKVFHFSLTLIIFLVFWSAYHIHFLSALKRYMTFR